MLLAVGQSPRRGSRVHRQVPRPEASNLNFSHSTPNSSKLSTFWLFLTLSDSFWSFFLSSEFLQLSSTFLSQTLLPLIFPYLFPVFPFVFRLHFLHSLSDCYGLSPGGSASSPSGCAPPGWPRPCTAPSDSAAEAMWDLAPAPAAPKLRK